MLSCSKLQLLFAGVNVVYTVFAGPLFTCCPTVKKKACTPARLLKVHFFPAEFSYFLILTA